MIKGDIMSQLVSIVIPVFNTDKYLKRCVNSILNQSYKNLEIILVDDGSSDDSGEICDKFQLKDKRIKIIHKKNEGVSAARNDGISNATGKYITFIDSDDYVGVDYIKNIYNKMEDNNIIICENAINFTSDSFFPNDTIKNDLIMSKDSFIKEILNEKKVNGVCWGKLYVTKIVKNVLFNQKYSIAEDLDFNIRYLEQADGDCKIINDLDYFYFINEGSLIHSSFNDKWYDEIEICKNLINMYLGTSNEIYCIKRFLRINLFCLINYYTDIKDVKEIKDNIRKYKKVYFRSNNIDLMDKFKLFLGLNFCRIINFLKKWRKKCGKSI